jgi:uncharacterized protein
MQAPQSAVLLRIYTEEGKRGDNGPLYEDIVLKARRLGLAGATVLRGPMGYGQSHVMHTAKILDLSARLPLVIEIVDVEERIQSLIDALDGMRDIGLVTTEEVQVVRYGKPTGR